MTFSVRDDLREISYQRLRLINKRDASDVLRHDGCFVSRVFQSYTYPRGNSLPYRQLDVVVYPGTMDFWSKTIPFGTVSLTANEAT
jgi:hypothetical protein